MYSSHIFQAEERGASSYAKLCTPLPVARHVRRAPSWPVAWPSALRGLGFDTVVTLRMPHWTTAFLAAWVIFPQQITSWWSGAALLLGEKIPESVLPWWSKIKRDRNGRWKSLEPSTKRSGMWCGCLLQKEGTRLHTWWNAKCYYVSKSCLPCARPFSGPWEWGCEQEIHDFCSHRAHVAMGET